MLPDVNHISDAPTYADALERAAKVNIEYKTRGTPLQLPKRVFLVTMLACGVLAAISGILGLVVSPELFAVVILCITIIGGMWLLYFASYSLARVLVYNVQLSDGKLKLKLFFFPYCSINIANVRWVGSFGGRRYIFTASGHRYSVPLPGENTDVRAEYGLFSILFHLGASRVREEAAAFIETGVPAPVPLTEGATHHRLPGLVFGLFVVLPFAGLLLAGVIVWPVFCIKERAFWGILFTPFTLVPGIYFFHVFLKGLKRFFYIYGFRKEEFTPKGYLVRGIELVSYNMLALTLYRGQDSIMDRCPGVLEIRFPDDEKIYIGPERQNFFALPWLLKEWAPDKLQIKPMKEIQEELAPMPYRNYLWMPPQGSTVLFKLRKKKM